MTVDNLPLTVLSAVDVGDAQGDRLGWAAIHRPCGVFEADGVG